MMKSKKTLYKKNQVVIAKRESDFAPAEMIEGYIYSITKDIDNEEWAEIRDASGNIKNVRTSQIREIVADADEVESNTVIGVSSPSIEAESEMHHELHDEHEQVFVEEVEQPIGLIQHIRENESKFPGFRSATEQYDIKLDDRDERFIMNGVEFGETTEDAAERVSKNLLNYMVVDRNNYAAMKEDSDCLTQIRELLGK